MSWVVIKNKNDFEQQPRVCFFVGRISKLWKISFRVHPVSLNLKRVGVSFYQLVNKGTTTGNSAGAPCFGDRSWILSINSYPARLPARGVILLYAL